MWTQEDGETVEEAARGLRRNRSSVWEILAGEHDERVGVGWKKEPQIVAGVWKAAFFQKDAVAKAKFNNDLAITD